MLVQRCCRQVATRHADIEQALIIPDRVDACGHQRHQGVGPFAEPEERPVFKLVQLARKIPWDGVHMLRLQHYSDFFKIAVQVLSAELKRVAFMDPSCWSVYV